MWNLLQKLSLELLYDPAIPHLLTYSKKKKRYRKQGRAQIFIHRVHSSAIHNSQKVETTQMFIDRCMDEQYVRAHTMEYYLALKLKEIRTPPIMRVNLRDMMLMK